jgi:hypothetical protein
MRPFSATSEENMMRIDRMVSAVALAMLRSVPMDAPECGYLTRLQLQNLGPGGLTDLVYRNPRLYVESMKRLEPRIP